MDVIAAVAALLCCVPDESDDASIASLLAHVGRVRGWLDAVEARLADRLTERRATEGTGIEGADPAWASTPAPAADDRIAIAQRSSVRHARRVRRRGRTLRELPELGRALDEGAATGEHVDAVQGAMSGLPQVQRRQLTDRHGTDIAALARRHQPDELAREVRRLGDAVARAAGVSRRTQQRSATRLRMWTDRASQMIHIDGLYDPATGVRLQQRLERAVDVLFRQAVPPDCPDDPAERQAFLRAHALALLVQGRETSDGDRGIGRGAASSGGEIVVIVDEQTLLEGLEHDETHIDVPGDVDPHEMAVDDIRRWAGEPGAVIVPVVLDADGVVQRLGRSIPADRAFHPDPVVAARGSGAPPVRWRWRAAELLASLSRPRRLDRGRTTRVADHHQRVALRVMYRTCAVPGCGVRFEHTTPHHVVWWGRDRGRTDLSSLLPLCHRHHHDVHDRGWRIVLARDRRLTVRPPGGRVSRRGPPVVDQRRLRAARAAWRAQRTASPGGTPP